MAKLNVASIQEQLKEGQRQQAKAFVESKVQSAPLQVAEAPVVEAPESISVDSVVEVETKINYKTEARRVIKSATEKMADAKKNKKSPTLRKMNMHVSELSSLAFERAVARENLNKSDERMEVVDARLIEANFLVGEMLIHLAESGDAEAEKLLKRMNVDRRMTIK